MRTAYEFEQTLSFRAACACDVDACLEIVVHAHVIELERLPLAIYESVLQLSVIRKCELFVCTCRSTELFS
jgi:hypothetical protein